MAGGQRFDLLRLLTRHGVDFVVVGAAAAVLDGALDRAPGEDGERFSLAHEPLPPAWLSGLPCLGESVEDAAL